MPKLVRTITYVGPQDWLDMCVDNSFVALKQELGRKGDKQITSQWRDVKAQRRAQRIDDTLRKSFHMGVRSSDKPARKHPLKQVDDL